MYNRRANHVGIAGFLLLVFAVFSSAAPLNDNFTNRFVLTGPSITVTGANFGASKELGEPVIKFDNGQNNAGGKSVWWSWTAPSNGVVHVSTVGSVAMGGTKMDTILGVYTGSQVTNLTWVTGNDDVGGGEFLQHE